MDKSTVISVIDKSNTSSIPNTKSVSPSKFNEDRKFNIVISGIPECDSGSPRLTWLAQDSSNATSTLHKIDPTLLESMVCDCYRLGKYKQNHSQPRLTLVKLSRTIDVINVLPKKDTYIYPSGITIKPDLPPEERAIESELLKQRWSLVQPWTDRKAIKIKRPSLYVHNKLYGTVTNSRFYKIDDHPNQTVTIEQPSNILTRLILHWPDSMCSGPKSVWKLQELGQKLVTISKLCLCYRFPNYWFIWDMVVRQYHWSWNSSTGVFTVQERQRILWRRCHVGCQQHIT